jgi:hypothetical protein
MLLLVAGKQERHPRHPAWGGETVRPPGPGKEGKPEGLVGQAAFFPFAAATTTGLFFFFFAAASTMAWTARQSRI